MLKKTEVKKRKSPTTGTNVSIRTFIRITIIQCHIELNNKNQHGVGFFPLCLIISIDYILNSMLEKICQI
jgi:hypothetical protein